MRQIAIIFVTSILSTACGAASFPDPAEIASEHACDGLQAATVDQSVADLRANVVDVEQIHQGVGKEVPRLVGAKVTVRATPGMTPEWMGRLLYCDATRHAADGLIPAGARSEVSSTGIGFAISVRSRQPSLAHDIERRAHLFAHLAP
jgi:hypothetical protein